MGHKIGQSTIVTPDREIPILYTNKALANAERLMDKGILGVLSGFQEGGSGILEVAILLQAGMEAARIADRLGGPRTTINQAYKILDDVGFTAVAAKVFEAIGEVISRDGAAVDLEFEDDDLAEKN